MAMGPNAEQRIERVIEKALCNYAIGTPGGATPLVIDALKRAGYAIVPVEPDDDVLAIAAQEFTFKYDLSSMGWILRAYKAVLNVHGVGALPSPPDSKG